jgi:hypothetical protein
MRPSIVDCAGQLWGDRHQYVAQAPADVIRCLRASVASPFHPQVSLPSAIERPGCASSRRHDASGLLTGG